MNRITRLLLFLVSLFAPVGAAGFLTFRDPLAGSDPSNHFVKKFDDDLKEACQQRKSRLEGMVLADYSVVGTSKSFDTVGTSEAQLITGRFQDIQANSTAHNRRWIDLSDYDHAEYLDSADKLKLLNDPTNKYLAAGVNAMNRMKDRVIIAALGGSARETTVAGATETSSLVALPSGQKVAVGGTNLTMAKLRTGIEILNAAEAGSLEEGGERFFAYTANQLSKLMSDSTVTSADYNTLRALQNYTIDTFMGLKWVRTELMGKSGNNRVNYMWAKEGVGLGVGADVKTDVSQDKTKRTLPWRTYVLMSLGCVRGKDNCVVEITCDETA